MSHTLNLPLDSKRQKFRGIRVLDKDGVQIQPEITFPNTVKQFGLNVQDEEHYPIRVVYYAYENHTESAITEFSLDFPDDPKPEQSTEQPNQENSELKQVPQSSVGTVPPRANGGNIPDGEPAPAGVTSTQVSGTVPNVEK